MFCVKNFLFLCMLLCTSIIWAEPALVLDGETLTIEQVVQVARFSRPIQVNAEAKERVARAHKLLLSAAKFDLPVYGLNRGVGLNKDRKIFAGDTLDPEVKRLSQEFNKNMIYSHSIGVGPNMPEELVRATMLVRLNSLLKGVSGIQPAAIDLFEQFLNQHIHPVLLCRGSIGEADIGVLSHIALAMIGEGDVMFQGVLMPAKEGLLAAGLTPLEPFAKDALSILSSNSYSTAYAALTVHRAAKLLNHMNVVFAMSLEGLNGNVAPFLHQVQALRPYCSQWNVAKMVRNILQGSFLWQPDNMRPLQDPLSFRDAIQIHGATLD